MKLPTLLVVGVAWAAAFTASPAVLRAQALIKHPPGAYAEVNGAKIWTESEGQGEPLVLVPGGKDRPMSDEESNLDVYTAIAGDDADFVIGGTIAPLDFTAELKKLKMPMLIIAGRYDRISLPRYAIDYKKYAPQATFVMMEKSGHFPFVEEPDKTLTVLRNFLRQPVQN